MKRNIFVSFLVTILLTLGLSFILLPPVKAQAKVRLNKTSMRLMVGNKGKLKVKGTSKKPKWSSANTNVAVVSGNGKVTAVGRGNTVITAKVGRKTLTCSLEVYVPALTLDKTSLDMYPGEKITLKAKIDPPESQVEWSSDNTAVATVADGVVTAVGKGSATVTVRNSQFGMSAKCSVTVYDKSLTLDSEAITILEGDEYSLTATTVPSGKTVTWSSSDETVATVSSEGTVTGIMKGTAKITARSMGLEKTCTVTVADEIPIESVVLDKNELTLTTGDSAVLEATVLPEFTSEDKTVTWTTSDAKVAVVFNGRVTAIRQGTARITASAGTHSAVCTVTVVRSSEDSQIKLDKESLTLSVNETAQLKATLSPSLSGQSVSWASTNKDVATVDDKGKVTAVSEGAAKVIAMAGAYLAYCDVTVVADPSVEGLIKLADYIEETGTTDEQGRYYVEKTDSSGLAYGIVELYANEFVFVFDDENASYDKIKTGADMTVSSDAACPVTCSYDDGNAKFEGEGSVSKSTFKVTDKIDFKFSPIEGCTDSMAQSLANATVKTALGLWKNILSDADLTYSDLGFKALGVQ